MVTPEYLRLMAAYNCWMNEKIYAAAARLPAAELMADRGAFFGSVFGTLNHVLVADLIWLKRFQLNAGANAALAPMVSIDMPQSLEVQLQRALPALATQRGWLDAVIEAWATSLAAEDLAKTVEYRNTRGDPFRKNYAGLAMHFFNHQTHHRGQATTLLHQAGIDVGETDLRALLPEES